MVHAWNSSTLEVEVAGPEVQGQPQLYSEFNTSMGYIRPVSRHRTGGQQQRGPAWVPGRNSPYRPCPLPAWLVGRCPVPLPPAGCSPKEVLRTQREKCPVSASGRHMMPVEFEWAAIARNAFSVVLHAANSICVSEVQVQRGRPASLLPKPASS